MNRSEKLLEAIGQIDDRLILDAQKAGGAKKAVGAASGKKKTKKKVSDIRYRNALAACAVLAICLGIYGLLAMEGLILSPFSGGSDSSESTQITTDSTMDMAEVTTAEDAAPEEEVAAEEAAVEEAALEDTASEAKAEVTSAEADAKAQPNSDTERATEEAKEAGREGKQESAADESEAVETTETAIAECAETEASETENSEETEAEDGGQESIGQMELTAAQQPMVMALGLEDEEVSGNETQPVQDLPAPMLEARLLKTAGADVTLSLSNQYTDATVTYGSMYELERQSQDGWSKVEAKDNVAWVDVLVELGAGKSTTETVRLSSMFGELEAGHYRLVKNCTVIRAEQSEEKIVIYTEFDIVK